MGEALVNSTIGRDGGGRTALMVLYFFPPIGGVATARNVRNAQYLPSYGWHPIVLATRATDVRLRDTAGLELVQDGVRVVRTRSFEAGQLRPLALRLRDVLAGFRGRGTPSAPADVAEAAPPAGSSLSRLRRLVFFPDDQAGWLPFAVAAGVREARRAHVEAVFSTSSPLTAHLVAGVVARLAGVPWVAEFRDPLTGNAVETPLPWLHRRLKTKLERWVVESADCIVCVTPSLTRLYQRRYRNRALFVTVPNGYDASERLPKSSRGGDGEFRIVHAGSLYRPSELDVFLRGVALLVARSPAVADRLRIEFYGDSTPECHAVFRRYTTSGPLARIIRVSGFVPRRDALQAVADADAALVLLGGGPGMRLFVGAKLYDYLGQNVQVLAMIPPGDARDLLESLSWGVIAEPEPESVAAAIERLIELPAPGRVADPEGRFDRRRLAGLLADVLTEAVDERRRGAHGRALTIAPRRRGGF